MNPSELLILTLGATLTTVVGVASYFIVKWIERVDKSIESLSTDLNKVSAQVVKLIIDGKKLPDDIKNLVDEQVKSIRKNPPNFSKLDAIEKDVQGVYNTVHNRVMPMLDAQKDNFGRIIVLEGNLQSYEKKLVTMYEVVTRLLAEKKTGQK